MKTAQEALAEWDAGGILWSVEMGGLGPGYEQAIQVSIMEIIREDEPLPTGDTFGDWGDKGLRRVGGLSGAQAGAAKSVAYRAMRDGWAAMLESVPQDRKIQISKSWPRAESKP